MVNKDEAGWRVRLRLETGERQYLPSGEHVVGRLSPFHIPDKSVSRKQCLVKVDDKVRKVTIKRIGKHHSCLTRCCFYEFFELMPQDQWVEIGNMDVFTLCAKSWPILVECGENLPEAPARNVYISREPPPKPVPVKPKRTPPKVNNPESSLTKSLEITGEKPAPVTALVKQKSPLVIEDFDFDEDDQILQPYGGITSPIKSPTKDPVTPERKPPPPNPRPPLVSIPSESGLKPPKLKDKAQREKELEKEPPKKASSTASPKPKQRAKVEPNRSRMASNSARELNHTDESGSESESQKPPKNIVSRVKKMAEGKKAVAMASREDDDSASEKAYQDWEAKHSSTGAAPKPEPKEPSFPNFEGIEPDSPEYTHLLEQYEKILRRYEDWKDEQAARRIASNNDEEDTNNKDDDVNGEWISRNSSSAKQPEKKRRKKSHKIGESNSDEDSDFDTLPERRKKRSPDETGHAANKRAKTNSKSASAASSTSRKQTNSRAEVINLADDD